MVWETKDLLVPRGSFPSNGNFEVQRDGVHLHKIITMALSGELLSNQGKVSLDQFKMNQQVFLTNGSVNEVKLVSLQLVLFSLADFIDDLKELALMVGDHPAVDCCLYASICLPVRGTDRRGNSSLFSCFFLTSFILDRSCIFNGSEPSI